MAKDPDQTKNDYSERIQDAVDVSRTRDKTAGEGASHEIRPEETRKAEALRPKRAALMLAEFDTASDCLHGAEKLRDAGYSHFDSHTPFPVHGMDRAMGLPD